MEETFEDWLKENLMFYDGVYYREDTGFIYDIKCLKKNFDEGKSYEGCGEVLYYRKWRTIDLVRFKKYCEENKLKISLKLFEEWTSTKK